MSAAPPAAIPDLSNILGGFILGAIFNVFLLGLVLSEAFTYFRRYGRSDKFCPLVTVLCVLVVIHSVITVRTAYHWGVQNFANTAILSFSPWSFTVEPLLTAIVASCVQLFFAWRVYSISNRRLVIPTLIVILSVGQLGWGIASTVMISKLGEFSRFGEFTYGAITWLVLACLGDGLITASMSYYLHAAKTEYGRTNTMIDRIIAQTVRTGLISTIVAICNMILFAFSTTTTWHIFPQLLLAPLYAISAIVSLNSRGQSAAELSAARNPTISLGELRGNAMDFSSSKLESGLGTKRPGNSRTPSMQREIPVHIFTVTTSQSSEGEDAVYPDKHDGDAKLLPLESPRKAGEQNWS